MTRPAMRRSELRPEDIAFEDGSETPPQRQLAPRTAQKRESRRRAPDPQRQRAGKRSRRKGNEAQREWARRIDGRNVGMLGDEDVIGPDGCLWEVKAIKKLTQQAVIDALEQVERSAILAGRDYGLAWRLPDRPANKRWLVIRYG